MLGSRWCWQRPWQKTRRSATILFVTPQSYPTSIARPFCADSTYGTHSGAALWKRPSAISLTGMKTHIVHLGHDNPPRKRTESEPASTSFVFPPLVAPIRYSRSLGSSYSVVRPDVSVTQSGPWAWIDGSWHPRRGGSLAVCNRLGQDRSRTGGVVLLESLARRANREPLFAQGEDETKCEPTS